MEIAGRKALVIGAARSGIASARFLAQRGATVALNDRKPLSEWSKEALDLKTEGVGLVEGDPPSWLLDQIDLVVVSPGVPTKSIPVRYADRRGAEVIGEIELASRFLHGRIVAITGTNGKTTTTSLIGEMLKDAGMNVQVGGNIGNALISMIDSSRDDGWSVVEVSSFQLETITPQPNTTSFATKLRAMSRSSTPTTKSFRRGPAGCARTWFSSACNANLRKAYFCEVVNWFRERKMASAC